MSLVGAVSKILSKLDFSSKGNAPRKYSCGRKDDFSWLTAPEQPPRKYDSSLSSPGQLCPNRLCRHFIVGKPKECPGCFTALRILIAAALVFAAGANAQTVSPWGMADSAVREFLAASWDTTNVQQNERGFCAMYTVRDLPFDWSQGAAYRIYELRLIMPRKSVAADQQSVEFACPDLPNIVRVHVHPPTTCEADGKCNWGGMLAWQCEPSPQDMRLLIAEDQAFGVIQCDRHALTFWGFKELRPPAAKRLTP
jgi:hypothetical protein